MSNMFADLEASEQPQAGVIPEQKQPSPGTGNMFADFESSATDKTSAIPETAQSAAIPEQDEGFFEGRTAGNVASDAGVTLAKGFMGATEGAVGLVDLATPGQFGKFVEEEVVSFEDAQSYAESLYSDPQQKANKKLEEAEGIGGTLKTALQNPSTIATAVGESIPLMLAGGAIARGLKVLPKASKLSPLVRAAMGEGAIAGGSSGEGIRQQSETGETTLKQDAIAATSGAGTALFGFLGGRLAGKLGLDDVDVLAAGGDLVEAATQKGIPRRVVEGFVSEGFLEELPQSVQEQVLQNIATDNDIFEGVDQAAVMGTLAGGVMGGAVNLRPRNTDIDMTGNAAIPEPGDNTPEAIPMPAASEGFTSPATPSADIDMTGKATEQPMSDGQFGDEVPGNTSLEEFWQQMYEEATANGQEFPAPPMKADSQLGEVIPQAIPEETDVIQQAADEAAASPNNDRTEPTERQKETGKYKKGPVPREATPLDMRMMIENPAESERSGKAEDGTEWSQTMQNHYGYIVGMEGYDKDKLDVFFGPEASTAATVHVVDQYNQAGEFDEHKVMLGFENEEAAWDGYHSNYDEGWNGAGAVTTMSVEEFKEWGKSGGPKKGALAPKPPAGSAQEILPPTVGDQFDYDGMTFEVDSLDDGRVVAADVESGTLEEWDSVEAFQSAVFGKETPMSAEVENSPISENDRRSQDVSVENDQRTGQERRSDLRNKRTADMTTDELRQVLLENELTGIPNRRAYMEATDFGDNAKPVQVSVDADSLKWVNDNMGHENGDALLNAVATTLKEELGEAFHVSGDEFIVQGDNRAEVLAGLERVDNRLKKAKLEYTTEDGITISKQGLEITYGLSEEGSYSQADERLKQEKQRRENSGERAGRGQTPPGVSRQSAEGRETQSDGAEEVINPKQPSSSEIRDIIIETAFEDNPALANRVGDDEYVVGELAKAVGAGVRQYYGWSDNEVNLLLEDMVSNKGAWLSRTAELAVDEPGLKLVEDGKVANANVVDEQPTGPVDNPVEPVVEESAEAVKDEIITRYATLIVDRMESQAKRAATENGRHQSFVPSTPGQRAENIQIHKRGFTELYEDVENKRLISLLAKLHQGNQFSIRMFNELTGLKVKTDKQIAEALRNVDPVQYDKIKVDASEERKQDHEKRKQQEMLDKLTETSRASFNGKTFENKKEFIDYLIAEGYHLYDEAKSGINTIGQLSKDGESYLRFKTKAERSYIQQQLEGIEPVAEETLSPEDDAAVESLFTPGGTTPFTEKDPDPTRRPGADKQETPAPTEQGTIEAGQSQRSESANDNKSYGDTNKVFTKSAADAALAKLLNTNKLSSNPMLDPELMQAGITLAGYHIEASARKFSGYVVAMRDSLGDKFDLFKPYLKSWYFAVKADPATAGWELDGYEDVEKADVEYILFKDNQAPPVEKAPVSDTIESGKNSQTEATDENGARGDGTKELSPVGQPELPADETSGSDAQQGSSQADSANMADDQPEDVEGTAVAGTRGETGVRPARKDVAAERSDGATGVPANGREGTGGTGLADAGTGRGDGDRGRVSDFHIDNPLEVSGGGPVARFEKNKAAIEMFNDLSDSGRYPTEEEQKTIAGYTGWGSFGQELFNGSWDHPAPKKGWEKRDEWLRDHLGEKNWRSAQNSIRNAHYTDPPTVMAMWQMVERMGFTGGKVLEPAMGIGNFFGMMPKHLKDRSDLTGIELDSLTGGMAKLLYQKSNISIKPYQDSRTPDNFYDLVIGNWPFDSMRPADRRYQKVNPVLHDYFFIKALDQVRPGGLVVGITSHGTMDKVDKTARRAMAQKGELVASFRLPSGAFKDYAGTAVVTDIIILRKRPEPLGIVSDSWVESTKHQLKGGEVNLNQFYLDNKKHIVGTIAFGHGTTSGRPGLIVNRPSNMNAQIERIVEMVPEDGFLPDTTGDHISYITNHTADREGAVTEQDGKLFIVRGEHLAPADEVLKYSVKNGKDTKKRKDQIKALISMRQAYAELIQAERSEGEPEPLRKALKKRYDSYVSSHGQLSKSYGLSYLKRVNDPFYSSLAALETPGKDGYRPAKILTQSTMRTENKLENPGVSQAYVVARNRSVSPSIDEVAKLANSDKDKVRKELVDSGAVFEVLGGDIVPSDIYLSGNVRNKLRDAEVWVKDGNTHLQRNIDELRKVIPKDISYHAIEVQMGATWVPESDYAKYVAHMLNRSGTDGIQVTFMAGRWKVRLPSQFNYLPEAQAGYGSEEVKFSRLVNLALSNQTMTVRKKDSDGNWYVDDTATAEVAERIGKIREDFKQWVWSDAERRVSLEREYNESRNSYAKPVFDGSFMSFPGMSLDLGSSPFNLRQHQADAIWRALVTRRSLNAHEVGTGKTFTMGGIAVESRRYGISRKPLLLAHNANSATVAAEIQSMYPSAQVLYIDNLSPSVIDTRLRQIANDDWDVVVMPHSLIDRLALTEETLMGMAQAEIEAFEQEAAEAAEEDGVELTAEMLNDPEELKKLRSPTAKDLVKARNKILENIRKSAQRASREGAIPFDELGIDMVLVDEAHEFKKPPLATKMKMKGLNATTSNKSIALQFLTRYIRANNNGGNVHLFTGTPITNTLTEVYHQMRYIMEDDMMETGVDSWDGWFGSFAAEVADVELNAAAEYENVTRLASFINVPELRRMIGQYMDVVFSDDMPEMVPRRTKTGKTIDDKTLTDQERLHLENGRTENAKDRPYKKIIVDNADMTEHQLAEFQTLQGYAQSWRSMSPRMRMETMRNGGPESPIITEGLAAKASMDVRLLVGGGLVGHEGKAWDDEGSKASRSIKNILEVYNSHDQATQVIFTEIGLGNKVTKTTRRADGSKGTRTEPTFSTVDDIVARLVAQGIPREEIAVVRGTTSKQKRKEIAEKMNASEIRIVVGNSKTLGVGVNMQKNLRAMHHLDAPWMPGDLEQRNGRGHRQGNQWNTVLEYRYITDRLDGRRWQVLSVKDRFIKEFLKANESTRVIEGDAAADEQNDILETFSSAAGDPRILLLAKARKKVEALQRKERMHTHAVADAKSQVMDLTSKLEEGEKELERHVAEGGIVETVDTAMKQAKESFSAVINGKKITERKKFDAALKRFLEKNVRKGDVRVPVGNYNGLIMSASMMHLAEYPSIEIDVTTEDYGQRRLYPNMPSIGSIESSLRKVLKYSEEFSPRIEEAKRSLERMQQVSQEPFARVDDLKAAEKAVSELEEDMTANPVPPPAWLRNGAPVDTEVYRNGDKFVVAGHRWTENGWFVLAEDSKGQLPVPYNEVVDSQGIKLYEEKEFVAPEVVERDESGQGQGGNDEARLSLAPKSNLNTNLKQDVKRLRERVKHLQQVFGPITRKWKGGPPVLVVETEQDLPNYLQNDIRRSQSKGRVRGLFDPKSNSVFIVAENITDDNEAQRILLHESVGHYGLRGLLGPKMTTILKQVALSDVQRLREIAENYGLDVKTMDDRLKAAEELLAEYAEQNKKPGFVNRVKELIKTWLNTHGFSWKYTDADLVALIARAKKRVENGPGPSPGGGVAMSLRPAGGVGVAKSALDKASPRIKNTIDYLRMKFQDKFIPLLNIQKRLVAEGWEMTKEANAYLAEELFHGKATKRLEDFYTDTVKPLMAAIEESSVTLEDVENYLYAKFSPQRNAYIASINEDMPDGGSGMKNAEAEKILNDFSADGKTAELERLARQARSITEMQRRIIREEGLELDETMDSWELNNPDYIPLKGGNDKASKGIGTGFNVKKSGTMKALGRRSKAENILAELFTQTGATIVRAEKAKVGRAFLNMVEENPNSEMWKVYDPKQPKTMPTSRKLADNPVVKRLKRKLGRRTYLLNNGSLSEQKQAQLVAEIAGIESELSRGKEKVVKNVLDPSLLKADNVMTVTREDGTVVYVEIMDEDLARVMKNLTPGQYGKVTQTLAKATRYLSKMSTSLNPEFVVTNFERDIQTAMVHLGGEQSAKLAKDVLKGVFPAMKGIRDKLRKNSNSEWAQWFERFQKAGAQVSFMDLQGVEDWQSKLRKLGGNAGRLEPTKANIGKLFDLIGDYNSAVENAVRLSSFRKAVEAGMDEADAASLAKNLTVNFNRKGELGPAMNALYMFANAGVQGSARIFTAVGKSSRVRKMMAGVMVMAFGLAEMNRLMAGDDDDDESKWDKIDDYSKQVNLIFGTDEGKFTVRLPYGYNVFVAAGYAMSDMAHYAAGDGGKSPVEAAKFMTAAIMNAFNPLGGDEGFLKVLAPTLADPLVEIATNENFMGGKIAPENYVFGPQKPDSELYFRNVSAPSKTVTSFLNSVTGGSKWEPGLVDISPETIDHMFGFWAGGLGRTIARAADAPMKYADGDLQLRDVPFLRQVYQEQTPYVDFDRFYDNINDIAAARANLKEMPAAGRSAFIQGHPEARLWKLSNGYQRKLSVLRKRRYAYLDAGDKQAARKVETLMQKQAKAFNRIYNGRVD